MWAAAVRGAGVHGRAAGCAAPRGSAPFYWVVPTPTKLKPVREIGWKSTKVVAS